MPEWVKAAATRERGSDITSVGAACHVLRPVRDSRIVKAGIRLCARTARMTVLSPEKDEA